MFSYHYLTVADLAKIAWNFPKSDVFKKEMIIQRQIR
jgi:hypothetical protein